MSVREVDYDSCHIVSALSQPSKWKTWVNVRVWRWAKSCAMFFLCTWDPLMDVWAAKHASHPGGYAALHSQCANCKEGNQMEWNKSPPPFFWCQDITWAAHWCSNTNSLRSSSRNADVRLWLVPQMELTGNETHCRYCSFNYCMPDSS